MESNISVEMPRYVTRKTVWAFKIKAIVPDIPDGALANGAMIYPEEKGYGPVRVEQAYIDKHAPQVGGYYVVYKDGYKSWSPAAAFEESATRDN